LAGDHARAGGKTVAQLSDEAALADARFAADEDDRGSILVVG
jgi:hypothetical protein